MTKFAPNFLFIFCYNILIYIMSLPISCFKNSYGTFLTALFWTGCSLDLPLSYLHGICFHHYPEIYFFFSNFLFSVIVFESYICWINKLHCYTEVSYLTIGLSFPPFFCWSIPQRFTKLYNSKYILHSLILDFFKPYFLRTPVWFFSVLLPFLI